MSEQSQEQKSQKRGVLTTFLFSLSKVLPGSLVGALGGPFAAGAVIALAGALLIGAPSAYFALKSQSAPAKRSSRDSAFAKLFGGEKGLTESLLPEEMRAAAFEEEEARSGEETTLGYLIPEELPAARKEDEETSKKDPALATYREKKLDKETLSKMKERFGSKPIEFAGGGSGSSAMAGTAQSFSGSGQVGLGAAASAMGAASGKSGKSSKTAIKIGKNLRAQQTGALQGARRAAALSQKAYSFDQLASGYSGAAFGEGKTTSILPQVGGAIVSGPAGVETQASVQSLEAPEPQRGTAPGSGQEGEGAGGGPGIDWGNVGIMAGTLTFALFAAWGVARTAQSTQTLTGKIALGVFVATLVGTLSYLWYDLVLPLFSQGPLGVIIGLVLTGLTTLMTWLLVRAYLWAQSPFHGGPFATAGRFMGFGGNNQEAAREATSGFG